MRLLVANDLDDSILRKHDVGPWAERMLWFARDGDTVVLMREPDPDFLREVTAVTGTDPSTLVIHVLPEGRHGRRMFDHHALISDDVVDSVARTLGPVESVHSQWPSPYVAEFARRLGLSNVLGGAAVYSQNAVEVLNSMGTFRVLAAAAGVPTAAGGVCRSPGDAVELTTRLLRTHGTLMVKKAHAGAGAGNLVVATGDAPGAARSGHAARFQVDDTSVAEFWEERWAWASADGRFPVVVERLVDDARSVYAEFLVTDHAAEHAATGELFFEAGVLVREEIPAPDLPAGVEERVRTEGHRLAELYRTLGHRGFLSVDTVVSRDGEVFVTEVNAQSTGSSHLHGVIRERAQADGGACRVVAQMSSPADWTVVDTAWFLRRVSEAGLGYCSRTGTGVLPATPAIPVGHGAIVYVVVGRDTAEVTASMHRLASAVRDHQALDA